MAKNFPSLTCSLLYLLWAVFIATSCSQSAPAVYCDPGWFGSNCQYKCRCPGLTCGRGGVCPEGVCERGWFGPGCQFVDLAYQKNSTQTIPLWLNDGNPATCNKDQSMKELTVEMSEFPFTWLRIQVNNPSLLHAFQVTFTDRRNQNSTACRNMKKATFNETTLDIHCDLDVVVKDIVIKGAGVKSLCSLYISGGRNVALRQKASQSSTYSKVEWGHSVNNSAAGNAVDGNTDRDWTSRSCMSTNVGDTNSTWAVELSSAHVINTYVVYNRNNNAERIMGFTLTSFTNNGKMVFSYTDRETTALQVYTVTHVPVSTPVSVVNIYANALHLDGILNMCEVELYGDSACPPLKYGPDCEHTCNCAVKDESCFVSTGGCPSGCAAGFQGEGCDRACDLGRYGLDCSSNCSQFCVATNSSRSPCLPTDGACVLGCVSGYQVPKCEHIVTIVKCDECTSVAAVVGSLVAFVILAMVAILGVFLWRRCRATLHNHVSTVQSGDGINDSIYYEMKRTDKELTNS